MGCRRAVTTPSLRFFRNDSIVIAHGQELSEDWGQALALTPVSHSNTKNYAYDTRRASNSLAPVPDPN